MISAITHSLHCGNWNGTDPVPDIARRSDARHTIGAFDHLPPEYRVENQVESAVESGIDSDADSVEVSLYAHTSTVEAVPSSGRRD